MSGPIPAYPLAWPAGWKRTPASGRVHGKFNKKTRDSSSYATKRSVTIAEALARVRDELERMGIHADDLVISTNLTLRLDGFPRSDQREPADPGVAVYWRARFDTSQPPKCMAIDSYLRVADNLAAVAATLDAMRAIERHGGAMILQRAFQGFTALPGPMAEDWREVLGTTDPEGNYKRLRAQCHPDRGGDAEQFQRVQRAWEQYQREKA